MEGFLKALSGFVEEAAHYTTLFKRIQLLDFDLQGSIGDVGDDLGP